MDVNELIIALIQKVIIGGCPLNYSRDTQFRTIFSVCSAHDTSMRMRRTFNMGLNLTRELEGTI